MRPAPSNLSPNLRRLALSLVVLLSFPLASSADDATSVRVELASDSVSWHTAAVVGHAILTVVGPDGYAARHDFEGDLPAWTVDGPDGRYTWELRYRAPIDVGASDDEPRVAWSRVASGSFTVRHGALVATKPGTEWEPRAPTKANTTHDGSVCIGTSCINQEVFGNDTLRLDQDDLRMHFDDTSASAPNNDWRILVNEVDSATDNSEYFAVEDATGATVPLRVDAGAGTDSLRIASDGDIGFGTATPMADVHVVSDDTPALRLDQDTSGGQTAQVWELRGDESYFTIGDVTDATSPFKIETNAPDDTLVVDADGEVGIGTATPAAPLHVQAFNSLINDDIFLVEDTGTTTQGRVLMKLQNNGQLNFVLERTDVSGNGKWSFVHNGSDFSFSKGGTGANELTLSDAGDLTIRGSLKANSGADVFPDYVFEDGYKLRSLDEVAAFIGENGHLPNVMSREDVQREGTIDMTRLQLQMLEKIEELMLYTLEQQRTIERLEARALAGSSVSETVTP